MENHFFCWKLQLSVENLQLSDLSSFSTHDVAPFITFCQLVYRWLITQLF